MCTTLIFIKHAVPRSSKAALNHDAPSAILHWWYDVFMLAYNCFYVHVAAQTMPAEIFWKVISYSANVSHQPGFSSHICLCLSVHISLMCIDICPFLPLPRYEVHTRAPPPLWHISSVIFPSSPPYAKKGICIPESGWQATVISSEGLWNFSDSAWKGDSKGKLCDMSWNVNRQHSARRLTRQLLAAAG